MDITVEFEKSRINLDCKRHKKKIVMLHVVMTLFKNSENFRYSIYKEKVDKKKN